MCGIFGTINSKKPKKFRYTAFASLGIINDSRGGDSCGIFIDKKYEYGVYTKKLFKDFMTESKILEEFRGKDVNIAIGHCRKASVGAVNEANAQPVIIKDKNGDPEFVLIHNGTIRNHDDLAKKYIPEVDVKDMTDSQIMARIFHKAGYSVLSEYYGGGVFFVVDYRSGKPICKFFQGYSRQTEYTKEEVQERPFFFSYREGTLVFSSIYEMLKAACPGASIWQPAPNTLYSYSEQGLISEREYPRDKVAQQMPYHKSTTTTTKNTVYGKTLANRIETVRNSNATPVTATTTAAKPTTIPVTGTTTQKNISLPKNVEGQTRSNDELIGQHVVYNYVTSKYEVNKIPLHGAYFVSNYGIILSDTSTLTGRIIWFFQGIPFLNKGLYFYDRLNNLCTDFGILPKVLCNVCEDMVRWISSDRIYRDPITNVLMVATSLTTHKPYTGIFMRLSDIYGSKFEDGIETCHTTFGTGVESITFDNNKDQGAVKIDLENGIYKNLREVCQKRI